MFIKKFKLENYRKFSNENNTVDFISAKILSNPKIKEQKIDVASDTTLVIGKNNAGKTTIITALDNLVNNPSAFGINDFNYRYLNDYLENYKKHSRKQLLPFIEFVITIELEEESNDRVSNLIPFMLVEDIQDNELELCIRYEIIEEITFNKEMKKIIKKFSKKVDEKKKNDEFYKLLKNTKFKLNFYDKNKNKIESDFRLSNIIEIKCIKANLLKKDNCLTYAFNKIINYRYDTLFKEEKQKINTELEGINYDLSEKIKLKHSEIVEKVIKEIISSTYMSINLRADITFEQLMTNLIKYEYIENNITIPEDQFGLGYTNLVMIIANIIDYMERYPESEYNSKINLISIEEPETYMHPQMQELFITNINNAINVLLSKKFKEVNTQIIITTHSSHILNSKIHSKNTFDNICYLYTKNNNAVVSNLSNELIMPNYADIKKDEFSYLKKHIKFKVSELFFSDAAIFVEGDVENTLLPYYISLNKKLSKNYISIFKIDGAHGSKYTNLIKALKIPVLIITDLDIKRTHKKKSEHSEDAFDETGSYKQIRTLNKRETTNKTIMDFYSNNLTKIPKNLEIDNIYIAYQGKIQGFYATSFEEAFILTNYNNQIINEVLKLLKPGIYRDIVGEENYENNINNSFKWQMKLKDSKSDFINLLMYKVYIVDEAYIGDIPKLPQYIINGLKWVEKQLEDSCYGVI